MFFVYQLQVQKKKFSLAVLPLTDAALKEHTKRVYYQIQLWLGHDSINPELWGWKRSGNILIPIMTTKMIAPKELLEIVSK